MKALVELATVVIETRQELSSNCPGTATKCNLIQVMMVRANTLSNNCARAKLYTGTKVSIAYKSKSVVLGYLKVR